MNKYDQQAKAFCEKTGTIIKKVYQGHRPYFADDTEHRAVFRVVFKRQDHQPFSIEFGNSIAASYTVSESYTVFGRGKPVDVSTVSHLVAFRAFTQNPYPASNAAGPYKFELNVTPPTDYAILACIEKYDPGPFEEFCEDLGYDPDSRKATKIYFAVQKQWQQVERFFTDKELELLGEIN